MKKTLVIGDIHNKYETVRKILDNWRGNTIFIGDYFDDFNDTGEHIQETAKWLKESLSHENRIHLMGNHDFHYMVQPAASLYCSGFSIEKYKIINSILCKEDWDKLKYFYHEDDYWFSHAGISRNWFEHPIYGTTAEVIESRLDLAKKALENRNFRATGAIYAADFFRGGSYEEGGILWNDWRNVNFFTGITQIVGHTPHNNIQIKKVDKCVNINVDTHLNEILFIENESFEIINTKEFIK